MSKSSLCPQCQAQLPRRGRFCLECGCDLYEQGVRRRPMHVVPLAVLVLAVAALVYYGATRGPGKQKSEEYVTVVEQLTPELLELAAEGEREDYGRIVARFYRPDEARYQRTHELLRDIVRDYAVELRHFRGACGNDPDKALAFVGKYEGRYPQYFAGLLSALMFEEGVLHTELGVKVGEERTRDFVAWYLWLAFRPVEPGRAEILNAGWEPFGEEDYYVVDLRFPQSGDLVLPTPIAGVADPRRLVWHRLGDGSWALRLGCLEDHFRLEEVVKFLQRIKP
jgi:hypothetical protein